MKSAVAVLLVSSFLVLGCGIPKSQYDLKVKEAESLTALKEEQEARIKKMAAEADALRSENAVVIKERDALQKQVDELAPKAERLEKASKTYENLISKLEQEIQEGEIQITEMKNRLTMTMVDKILFPSGSAVISKKGKTVLDKVVTILKDITDKRIQVEGHTDNVPITSAVKKKYPTNWELSTARASEVVRYLQDTGGLDPKFLSATGYSEFQPVAPNDSEAGRRKNRRIEIVLLPLME